MASWRSTSRCVRREKPRAVTGRGFSGVLARIAIHSTSNDVAESVLAGRGSFRTIASCQRALKRYSKVLFGSGPPGCGGGSSFVPGWPGCRSGAGVGQGWWWPECGPCPRSLGVAIGIKERQAEPFYRCWSTLCRRSVAFQKPVLPITYRCCHRWAALRKKSLGGSTYQ